MNLIRIKGIKCVYFDVWAGYLRRLHIASRIEFPFGNKTNFYASQHHHHVEVFSLYEHIYIVDANNGQLSEVKKGSNLGCLLKGLGTSSAASAGT